MSEILTYLAADSLSPSTSKLLAAGSPAKLRNSTNRWVAIEEIAFPVEKLQSNSTFGADVKCGIKSGSVLIADDVPLWCMSEARRSPGLWRTDQSEQNPYFENPFSYRPPCPILLPPGRSIEVSLSIDRAIQTLSGYTSLIALVVPVGVVLHGYQVDAPGGAVPTPFVSKWLPSSMASGAIQIAESPNSALANPSPGQAEVSHLVGRVYSSGPYATPFAVPHDPRDDVYHTEIDTVQKYTTVRARLGDGTPVIRDPTPFAHVFGATDRTWPLHSHMGPGGRMIMQIYSDLRTVNFNASSLTFQIAMHGTRMCSAQELGA